MKIDLSLAQANALEAAAAGSLSRPDEQYPHWRITYPNGRTFAVTPTARILLLRGLIEETDPVDGQIGAALTATGRAVLDELASRNPSTTGPKGTPDQ